MNALIVVDAQYDFMPGGGSLPVTNGHFIVPVINRIRPDFDTVVFTQDWHPANHCSFKENGGIWPVHCVQESHGAELNNALKVEDWDIIIQKGTNPLIDSYSAFFDNDHKAVTELHEKLRDLGIRDITVCGLATDYCVKFTVLDALSLGYAVNVFEEGCRGVDVKPGDSAQALRDMARKGAVLV